MLKFISKILQRNKVKALNGKIFPLSCNPQLEGKNLDVYYNCLEEAFGESRIKNIAITGGFGIGKSSVIKSFEKKHEKKHKINYLYVSLGDYARNSKIDDEINVIEYRLLMQIYSRFHKKDMPSSGFTLVHEKIKFHFLKAFFCSITVFSMLLLIFREQLGTLLIKLNLFSGIITNRHLIQLLLYLGVITFWAIISGVFCHWLLPKLKLGKFSLKSDHAELNFVNGTAEKCLDKYTLELVYCLERVNKKIGRTVVFEDMDRLDPSICIELFTRLKEINHLLNSRLKSNYIRFIYVVNDDIMSRLNHSKFFDYCLPIMPNLNRKNAELIFTQNLKHVNRVLTLKLKQYIEETYFEYIEDNTNPDGIINIIAPFLIDYRTQYAILNDYGLLFELYCINNVSKIGGYHISKYEAEYVLAFATYKNMWPEDYHKIYSGEDNVFSCCNRDKLDHFENFDLLYLLLDPAYPRLSVRSLYYAGYNENLIVERQNQILNSSCDTLNKIRTIDTIQASDILCIENLCQYCKNNIDLDEEILIAVVKCMIRCEYKKSGWFFNQRDIKTCLKVLEKLPDEQWELFISWAQIDTPFDIYKSCLDRNKIAYFNLFWTTKLVDIFCCGVKSLDESIIITLCDETHTKINLTERVIEYHTNKN